MGNAPLPNAIAIMISNHWDPRRFPPAEFTGEYKDRGSGEDVHFFIFSKASIQAVDKFCSGF
jgi:hypothetical protein